MNKLCGMCMADPFGCKEHNKQETNKMLELKLLYEDLIQIYEEGLISTGFVGGFWTEHENELTEISLKIGGFRL